MSEDRDFSREALLALASSPPLNPDDLIKQNTRRWFIQIEERARAGKTMVEINYTHVNKGINKGNFSKMLSFLKEKCVGCKIHAEIEEIYWCDIEACNCDDYTITVEWA